MISLQRVYAQQLAVTFFSELKRIEKQEPLHNWVGVLRQRNAEMIQQQFPAVCPIFEHLFLKTPQNPFTVIYSLLHFLDEASAEDLQAFGLSAHEIIEMLEKADEELEFY